MKVLVVGAELFHADGWADMRKLIVAFSACANAPKKTLHSVYSFISTVHVTPILNGDFISRKHSLAGSN
jgi:hypothetical protein